MWALGVRLQRDEAASLQRGDPRDDISHHYLRDAGQLSLGGVHEPQTGRAPQQDLNIRDYLLCDTVGSDRVFGRRVEDDGGELGVPDIRFEFDCADGEEEEVEGEGVGRRGVGGGGEGGE